MSDKQKSKVYRSEPAFAYSNKYTLKQCQKRIDKLQKKYMNKNNEYFVDKITVICTQENSRTAWYNVFRNQINLPKFGRNEYIILHEFAHYLTNKYTSGYSIKIKNLPNKDLISIRNAIGHNEVFVHILLELVRKELGEIIHDHYKAQFAKNNVKTINKKGESVKVRKPKNYDEALAQKEIMQMIQK
jgi:hypothetical protein